MTKHFATVFVLLFIISLEAKSQNRTNDPLPVISKLTGQLSTAQGWFKNSSGEWLGRKNKIVSNLGKDTKVLENYQKYSLGQDNFIAFEKRDITIDGNEYTLILKKYRDGFYKYESIEEGWVPQTSCEFYILDPNEIAKIESVEHNIPNDLALEVVYSGDIKYIDLKTLTNTSIAKEIKRQIKENHIYGNRKLGLTIACYDEKKVVQFYFYDRSFELKIVNIYYEATYLNFNNFINTL